MPKGFLLKLSNHTLNWEPRTYRQINYDTFAKNIDHLIYLELDEKPTHIKRIWKKEHSIGICQAYRNSTVIMKKLSWKKNKFKHQIYLYISIKNWNKTSCHLHLLLSFGILLIVFHFMGQIRFYLFSIRTVVCIDRMFSPAPSDNKVNWWFLMC